MTTVTIELEVDEKELMSSIFDNLHQPWWLEYDWDWKANEKEVQKEVGFKPTFVA